MILNYTHFEENLGNNPNDKILINYGAIIPKNNQLQGWLQLMSLIILKERS